MKEHFDFASMEGKKNLYTKLLQVMGYLLGG